MYKTQMQAARKGIITEEMKIVAKKEKIAVEYLREKMAEGKIIIPANKNHKNIDPQAVGEGLRTKINVNLGISKDCKSFEVEMEKVETALNMGVEAIMDLSSYGKTREFRQLLIEKSPAMIGTVPVYDAIGFMTKSCLTSLQKSSWMLLEDMLKMVWTLLPSMQELTGTLWRSLNVIHV